MASETKFSTTWKASIKPKKQRLYRYHAPHHVRGHFLNVHLSKELRAKYHKRAVRVRKGDKVAVIRGQFSGKSGAVARVDCAQTKIYVDGVEHHKKDGTKSFYPLVPNHVVITDLDKSDKRRVARIERSPVQKQTQKPQKQIQKSVQPKTEIKPQEKKQEKTQQEKAEKIPATKTR